jgi:hypothetical protein
MRPGSWTLPFYRPIDAPARERQEKVAVLRSRSLTRIAPDDKDIANKSLAVSIRAVHSKVRQASCTTHHSNKRKTHRFAPFGSVHAKSQATELFPGVPVSQVMAFPPLSGAYLLP